MAGVITKIFDEDKEAEANVWPQSLVYSEHIREVLDIKKVKLENGKWLMKVTCEMVPGHELDRDADDAKNEDRPPEPPAEEDGDDDAGRAARLVR